MKPMKIMLRSKKQKLIDLHLKMLLIKELNSEMIQYLQQYYLIYLVAVKVCILRVLKLEDWELMGLSDMLLSSIIIHR